MNSGEMEVEFLTCDVLVVGGGAAGCFSAIKAAQSGAKVVLVDKGRVAHSGASVFAAGAINICTPDDDKDQWFQEIVTRGENLNGQEWVKIQLQEGYELAEQLYEWGLKKGKKVFEKEEGGNYIRRRARGNINTLTSIVNAREMMDTLRQKAIDCGVILTERVMVFDLILSGGSITGAVGFGYRDNKFYVFRAKAVVLAAGGCGFKSYLMGHRNMTGEAQKMAYEAGAILRNLDQAMSNSTHRDIDMHGMSHMSGAGGKFLNNQDEEFMLKYDSELGSRARLTKLVYGMATEVEAGRGPIFMDLTACSQENRDLLRQIVPEGFKAFEMAGVDPFREKMPWIPAFMGTQTHGGGVDIDLQCATNVPGLYACGDTTSTPEHGTWSITGLNITFCFISGARSGLAAASYCHTEQTEARCHSDNEMEIEATKLIKGFMKPLFVLNGYEPDIVTRHIQEVLIPYKTAYLRNEERLNDALWRLENIRDYQVPFVKAQDNHGLVKANEVKSMICIAELIVRSVLARKESRGFVYRLDYPNTDNENWLKWIMVKGGTENKPEVYTEDVPLPYLKPVPGTFPYDPK